MIVIILVILIYDVGMLLFHFTNEENEPYVTWSRLHGREIEESRLKARSSELLASKYIRYPVLEVKFLFSALPLTSLRLWARRFTSLGLSFLTRKHTAHDSCLVYLEGIHSTNVAYMPYSVLGTADTGKQDVGADLMKIIIIRTEQILFKGSHQ